MPPPSQSRVNITVSVPAGTTSHGVPGLLCTPPRWYDFVIFFFSNYFAHVVTIISSPGQRWPETIEASLFALILPISGLARAVSAAMRQPATERDPVRRAARAGALCMVVKRRRGHTDRQEWWHKTQEDPIHCTKVCEATAKVHGQYSLKPNCMLVVVPSDAPVSSLKGAENASSYVLASTYNLPKLLISLIQAVWALVTLYRSRGNQIETYGYAAFGLTVAQYACMSIANVVGNLLRPDYPSLFMIRTPEMDSAEKDGCVFVGEIDVHIGHTNKSLYSMASDDERRELYSLYLALILGFTPFAIVGGLSGFQKKQSEPLERGFTLSWLVASMLLGPILRGFHFVQLDGANMMSRFTLGGLILLVFGAPAIGGMVVVGLMIQKFGTCNRIG